MGASAGTILPGTIIPIHAIGLPYFTSSLRFSIENKADRMHNQPLIQRANAGDASAQHLLANAYYRGDGVPRNPQLAAKWLRKAAEAGYAPAQCDLGFAYQNGLGVEQSYDQTVKWY